MSKCADFQSSRFLAKTELVRRPLPDAVGRRAVSRSLDFLNPGKPLNFQTGQSSSLARCVVPAKVPQPSDGPFLANARLGYSGNAKCDH